MSTGFSWNWHYDQAGRPDRITAPGNVTTRISYAEANAKGSRELTTTIATGNELRKLKHDYQGRLLSAEGSDGSITFIHNKAGLPSEVRSDGVPTLSYQYDLQDRLIEMAIGKSTSIKYRYDFLGRLAAMTTPAGEITYSYHRAVNTVVRRLPNGVQTFRKYDNEGKLIELTHADSNNRVIAGYIYDYRPDGLIETITESTQRSGTQQCRYQYNLMHRLTDVECSGKGASYHYDYDSHGNQTESQTLGDQVLRFTSTPAGALATDSRGAPQLDKRGHIRRISDHSGAIDYDFNEMGELAAANKQSVQYRYNALGLMTSRNVGGNETKYLPDPFADAWQPLWRRNAEGKETVTIWDGAVPLVEVAGKSTRYHLEDHLGSVRVELNAKGSVTTWHDHTPYGAPDETKASRDLYPAFAGHFWDPVAKVYLTKARAYDPVSARFLQPDPQLRVPDESKHNHSLYTYSGGDPVNFVDRNGAEAGSFEERWNGFKVWTKAYWGAYSDGVVRDTPRWLRIPKLKDFKVTGKFVYGLSNPPLAKGTEHPDVLNEITTLALENTKDTSGNIDIDKAALLAIRWRYGDKRYPYPGKSNPTNAEFATAENSLTAGSLGMNDGKYLATAKIEVWRRVKYIGDRLGISPDQMNIVTKNFFGVDIGGKTWEPTTDIRLREQYKWARAFSQLKNDNREPWHGKWTKSTTVANTRSWETTKSEHEIEDMDIKKYHRSRLSTGGGSSGPGGGGPGWPGPGGGGSWHSGPGGGGSWGSGPGGSGSWHSGPGSGGSLGGTSYSKHSPTPVGGVYLGGAAKLLEGLGQLKGIAVDDKTGKLVLIGSNDNQITLPPLRLDDIVTVFRAVYNHGQSPSVTIDPDEQNPKGPTMDVKHGPGTEGTYVGWVLFECDRVMKSYQLGEDNVTRDTVLSKIPGYKDMLDAVYFGGKTRVTKSEGLLSSLFGIRNTPGENWERFWIVPASVKRFDTKISDLSLFEIPLKVNTQKMQWKNGKLIDDERGKSSFGANAFKTWFSDHYAEIADEVQLKPPESSGLNASIAIFHELRRIALITAIAERLRESGQSMPTWMRDYVVAPFPVSKTTPSLTMKKEKKYGTVINTARIYGGVNLAPADKDVYAYNDSKASGTAAALNEHVKFVELSIQAASSLNKKLPELFLSPDAVGNVHTFKTADKKTYTAAILPGAETKALAPNRQVVTDMEVAIGLGRSINFTRYYNSYFDPAGELGTGWTLDLPKLQMTRVPEKRDGKRSQYRVVPHLVSPLGGLDIRFDNVKRVEPYAVDMFVSEDHPEIAGISSGSNTIVGSKTHQVLFRDGTVWHFDDKSRMVLVQTEGTATRYIWDNANHVRQIAGYIGLNAVADIKLDYDQQGRIIVAKAQQADFLQKLAPPKASEITFKYSTEGRLSAVTNGGAGNTKTQRVAWTYAYEKNHLTQVTRAGGAEVSYGYDTRGQLLWEKQGKQKNKYTLKTTPQGTVLTNAMDKGNKQPIRWTYDVRMRPVKVELGGNRTIQWQFGQDHEVSQTLYQGNKQLIYHKTSRNGKSETTTLADGTKYEVHRDAHGQPITLMVDGVLAVKASWTSNGSFAGLRSGNTEIQPRRHKEGWPNGLLISAPKKSGKTSQWLEYEWDVMERPIKITDSSGFDYVLDYDEQGRLNTYGQLTKDGKLAGAKIVYNKEGLITNIDSSWEKEKREYTSKGVLKSITIKRKGTQSKSVFDALGRLTSQSAFDKATTTWRYDPDKDGARLKEIKLPDGELINYSWDESGKTPVTDISMGSTKVRTQFDAEGRMTKMLWLNE